MDILDFAKQLRFDEEAVFDLKIPHQQKPKDAFAQLPDMPGNPFFERIDWESGHVYRGETTLLVLAEDHHRTDGRRR